MMRQLKLTSISLINFLEGNEFFSKIYSIKQMHLSDLKKSCELLANEIGTRDIQHN